MLNKRKIITSVSALAMLVTTAAQAQVGVAGRQLDVIGSEITGNVPITGLEDFGITNVDTVDIFGIQWDPRCASVEYTFNTAIAANPGTPAEISTDVLEATVQTGLDRWNDNPSSFIEMNVTNRTDLGLRARGFDFINEVTFFTPAGFTALASSPSVSLMADATFNPGDDLDGDGDSDVYDPAVEGINVCTDINGDGDIEFPAGDYAAGTILENDVQFSSTVLWELDATDFGGADVDAVSTHEFGHSHGLSHAMNNQTSATDGTGTTMFPFIATNEGDTELATREPHPDDFAQSAVIYQEGSASTGIAALQRGDVAFDRAYDLISGTTSTVVNDELIPRVGANVRIEDLRTGELISETFSGTTTVSELTSNGFPGLFAFDVNGVNGDYVVPVLRNPRRLLAATIQAPDGSPAGPGGFSTHVTVSNIVSPLDFTQENYSGRRESNREAFGDLRQSFRPRRGVAAGVDFITNDVVTLTNHDGSSEFGGAGFVGNTNIRYVERFDGADVQALLADNILTGFAFAGNSFDSAISPEYTNASLYFGETLEDGTVRLVGRALSSENDVQADDDDFTFVGIISRGFERTFNRTIRRSPDLDLFIVVEADNPVLDRNGTPSTQMSIDFSTNGSSFVSLDNGTGGDIVPIPALFGIDFIWNMELRFQPR